MNKKSILKTILLVVPVLLVAGGAGLSLAESWAVTVAAASLTL